MQTLHFSTTIDAPRERVWEALWSDAGYRHWTAPFGEGSYAEGEWKEGAEMRFLGPDKSGMLTRIGSLRPLEEVVFVYEAEIIKGAIQPKPGWAGAREQYRLSEQAGSTLLEVSVDGHDKFAEFLQAAFPKALSLLKEGAETGLA